MGSVCAGCGFEFVDLADRETGQLGNEIHGHFSGKHFICGFDHVTLFTAFLADSDATLLANSDAALLADSDTAQFCILLMDLINHIRVPPFIAHFGFADRFINRADQRQFGFVDRIALRVVHVPQNLAQRVADLSARARRVEEQLVGFVVQLCACLAAYVAEGVEVPAFVERVEGADEDHEAGAEPGVKLSALELVDVHVRLIQPRALGQPRVPRGLHFEVVYGLSVVNVDVQPDGAPVEGLVQRFLYVQF